MKHEGFAITPQLGGCWEAEIPSQPGLCGCLGCRQGYGSWRWGWVAANTRQGLQIHKDWEGEEGSSVSSDVPPFFRLVA